MNELEFKIALLKRYKESIKYLDAAKERMTNEIDKIEDFENEIKSETLVTEYTYIFNVLLGFNDEELQALIEKSMKIKNF